MSTLYSIGQMNQLGDALEKAGFTPADVTALTQYRRLSDFLCVLNGGEHIVHNANNKEELVRILEGRSDGVYLNGKKLGLFSSER